MLSDNKCESVIAMVPGQKQPEKFSHTNGDTGALALKLAKGVIDGDDRTGRISRVQFSAIFEKNFALASALVAELKRAYDMRQGTNREEMRHLIAQYAAERVGSIGRRKPDTITVELLRKILPGSPLETGVVVPTSFLLLKNDSNAPLWIDGADTRERDFNTPLFERLVREAAKAPELMIIGKYVVFYAEEAIRAGKPAGQNYAIPAKSSIIWDKLTDNEAAYVAQQLDPGRFGESRREAFEKFVRLIHQRAEGSKSSAPKKARTEVLGEMRMPSNIKLKELVPSR